MFFLFLHWLHVSGFNSHRIIIMIHFLSSVCVCAMAQNVRAKQKVVWLKWKQWQTERCFHLRPSAWLELPYMFVGEAPFMPTNIPMFVFKSLPFWLLVLCMWLRIPHVRDEKSARLLPLDPRKWRTYERGSRGTVSTTYSLGSMYKSNTFHDHSFMSFSRWLVDW